jgi:hypothetical protein
MYARDNHTQTNITYSMKIDNYIVFSQLHNVPMTFHSRLKKRTLSA